MSGMYYDHAGVDQQVASFGSINNGIEQNNGDIQNWIREVNSVFRGHSAEEWHQKVSQCHSKLVEYQQSCAHLKSVIDKVAGSGGEMQITDKDQGSRFSALHIPS